MYQWDDGTMGHFLKYKYSSLPFACAAMRRAGGLFLYGCDSQSRGGSALCERDQPSSEVTTSQTKAPRRAGIQVPVPSDSTVDLSRTVCPSGHWTHEFLACDTQSACWQQDNVRQWRGSKTRRNMTSPCQFPFSEMFTCTSGVGRVPYSLVCDHSQDCLDNSDEDFCVHPSCTGATKFECSNGQVSVCVCLFLC